MAESSLPQDDSGSFEAGSEVMFALVCYPCDNAGEITEAVGYCTDCREHMCATCLKCHSKTSLTKHHELVDKINMPEKQVPSRFSDICTQRCHVHKDEVVSFYCSAHKALGCGDCMVTAHDTCQGKLHIPEEAKTLASSSEFADFHVTMARLIKKSNNVLKSAKSYMTHVTNCLHKSMNDIETFRQEINDVLDELKVSLEQQAKKIVAQETATSATIVDATSKMHAELQSMSSTMDTLMSKNQQCQIFIEIKTLKTKLAEFQQQLEKAETSGIIGFKFKPCEDLQTLVKAKEALGELIVMNKRDMRATHVADINVKSRQNTKTCRIDGAIVLCKDTLVIADSANTSVKLVDTRRKQILSEYKLANAPYDVTTVSSTRAAITVPDAHMILFLNAEKTLSFDKEVHVKEQCGYIACIDNQLVVSFYSDPPSVGLLSMTGDLLKTFSTSSLGEQQQFNRSLCVTTSEFSRAIYASDWQEHRVLMFDLDGNCVAEYQDDNLNTPFYTVVHDLGLVFVCDMFSNSIHVLTSDCSNVKVLLTEGEGINLPRSICYCKDRGKMYVGMPENDIIKVFQLQ